jgi:hypothetical protein
MIGHAREKINSGNVTREAQFVLTAAAHFRQHRPAA